MPISVSIGVTSFPVDAPTAEGLLGTGDQALYAAKQLGRDRAVLFNSEIVSGLMSAESASQARADGQLAALLVLVETMDARGLDAEPHSKTASRCACLVARRLGLSEERTEQVRVAGLLNDVGKIGMSEAILDKPGPLSDAEWTEMRKHPEVGAQILSSAGLDEVAEWVLAHHESPDGSGYPYGLDDERIPLEAKILSAANAFAAMTSARAWRPAMSFEDALAELDRCSGTQFDPAVAGALAASVRDDVAMRVA